MMTGNPVLCGRLGSRVVERLNKQDDCQASLHDTQVLLSFNNRESGSSPIAKVQSILGVSSTADHVSDTVAGHSKTW
jgi:hypothetical protein